MPAPGHAHGAGPRERASEGTGAGGLAGLALTMGDPAGIGPEIALKAWVERLQHALPPFAVYGDLGLFEARARLLGLNVPLAQVADAREAPRVFSSALPVVAIPVAAPVRPGHPDDANAPAIIQAIERAVSDIAAGRARAMVTAPIAKNVLYAAGFEYPGHTEFLAHLAARHWPGCAAHPIMMIASDALRVVPLTIHVPLKDVPPLITRARITEAVRITWQALRHQFGIEAPRIAVAGLNPHAGEAGTIGREDADTIAPAIRDLCQEGLAVTGPHSADTLFHAAARRNYDAAICMYHDQALIPAKTLAFDEGVNVTLGLPFVRTSPDHGTAFDIAGAGRANPSSLLHAIRLAGRMSPRPAPSAPAATRMSS